MLGGTGKTCDVIHRFHAHRGKLVLVADAAKGPTGLSQCESATGGLFGDGAKA